MTAVNQTLQLKKTRKLLADVSLVDKLSEELWLNALKDVNLKFKHSIRDLFM